MICKIVVVVRGLDCFVRGSEGDWREVEWRRDRYHICRLGLYPGLGSWDSDGNGVHKVELRVEIDGKEMGLGWTWGGIAGCGEV